MGHLSEFVSPLRRRATPLTGCCQAQPVLALVLRRILLGEVTVSRIVDPNGGSRMGHLSEFVSPLRRRATPVTGCCQAQPVLVQPVRACDALKLEHTKSRT